MGRFLRRSSLDELPQLWHVLTGEMSLVGPRPLPVRDVGRFDEPWLMRRFSMRPGLTCLWQVSGRSELGFDRWVALDLKYAAATRGERTTRSFPHGRSCGILFDPKRHLIWGTDADSQIFVLRLDLAKAIVDPSGDIVKSGV